MPDFSKSGICNTSTLKSFKFIKKSDYIFEILIKICANIEKLYTIWAIILSTEKEIHQKSIICPKSRYT